MNADASKRKPRNAPRPDPAPPADAPLADLDRRARERLLDKLIQFVEQADPADLNYAQLARAIRDLAAPMRAKDVAQPPPAVNVAQPPPAVNVAQPPPAVNVAQPPSAVNVARPPPAVSTNSGPQPASRRHAFRADHATTDGPRAPAARHRPDAPVRTAESKFLRSIFGDRVDIPRTLLDEAFSDIYGLELPPETTPPPAPPSPSRGERRGEDIAPPSSPAASIFRPYPDAATPPPLPSTFSSPRSRSAAGVTSTANTPRGPPSPATSASAPAPD